jgi:glycosyltransferase involved in cell wall biosynthesis
MGDVREQPGGLNRYVDSLLAALAADGGARTRCIVVGDDGTTRAGVVSAAPRNAFLLRRLWRYARVANRFAAEADVVDSHFALNAALAIRCKSARRLPFVAHFHGPLGKEAAAMGESTASVLIKRRLERRVLRRAQQVVVLSNAFRDLVIKTQGVAPWNVRVIWPGVDLDRFTPGDPAAARDRLGLPVDGALVVVVRRLVARMGVDTLLEAWREIGSDGATLVVAGDGPERVALEADAETIRGDIRFLGAVDDDELVAILQAADLMVVPSRELEGFGLVTLEAFACGCPVLVTDAGGLAELPRQLDPSAVMPANDARALADRLVAWRSGAQALPDRQACRAFAEQFSWTKVAAAHRALYHEVVNGKPRPRVAVVTHTAELGGAELALVRLINAARHGADFHVIVADDGPLVDLLRGNGISCEVIPIGASVRDLRRRKSAHGLGAVSGGLASAAFAARLARRLRALRPDVVHLNTLKAGMPGSLAAKATRASVVWHVRDLVTAPAFPSVVATTMQQAIRRLSNAIIANSAATLAVLPPNAKQSRVVLPSPVDLDTFSAVTPTPHDGLCFAVVGRLARWKGQELFLRAFAEAFPDGDERAVIIGGALFGEEAFERALHDLAEELGIQHRVAFRGQVRDVATELAVVDVVVHCSIEPEPFGQVVVEAMAAGLPVVASGEGGPAEIVSDGADGLLFEPRNVGSLAAAMRRLADDAGLRAALGAAGAVSAQRFAPDKIGEQLLTLYTSVRAEKR